MERKIISTGDNTSKKFLITCFGEGGNYQVEEITITQDEYDSGELESWGVYPAEEYDLLTPSAHECRNAWDIERGDILDISGDCLLMRLA